MPRLLRSDVSLCFEGGPLQCERNPICPLVTVPFHLVPGVCSEARQSAASAWGWPPQELAGPLPLLQPAEGGAAGGKRLRLAGQPDEGQRAAPPLGLPPDWHAAEAEAALAAALQAAALPPALDGAAPGANSRRISGVSPSVLRDCHLLHRNAAHASWASAGFLLHTHQDPMRYRHAFAVGAAVHEYIASIAPEMGRADTSSSEAGSDMAWQQRLESAFGARLSQLGVPDLPRVVLPPPREPAEAAGAGVSLQLIGESLRTDDF